MCTKLSIAIEVAAIVFHYIQFTTITSIYIYMRPCSTIGAGLWYLSTLIRKIVEETHYLIFARIHFVIKLLLLLKYYLS
jgi:hypothetical protein